MEISHIDIKDYILDKCKAVTLRELTRLRQEESTTKLLLDMIDNLKQISTPQEDEISKDISATFADVEDIISNIQAGMVESEYAQKIINRLIQSPVFFERFHIKLNQIASIMNHTDDLPEIKEIEIKTDEKILSEMGVLNKVKMQQELPTGASYFLIFKPRWGKIIDIIKFPKKMIPKFAYSTIAILIITFAGNFGIRYYNTTYQLLHVENLLENNYRIYMSDSPRLSGAYGSTGISQLMDGDEAEVSYISEALNLTRKVVSFNSESPKALQLQAHIFFIQQKYLQADSVLQLIVYEGNNTASILNDLGVLKFAQRDIKKSIHYFESTIKIDPNFKEAYYNLAIAKSKTGDTEEAIKLINQFLNIENDEGWKNAALNLLDELQQ